MECRPRRATRSTLISWLSRSPERRGRPGGQGARELLCEAMRSGGRRELVGQAGEAVADRRDADEVHWLLVIGLAEQALTGPEHDREDDQAQLVHQVVVDQRSRELVARVDDDFSVEL